MRAIHLSSDILNMTFNKEKNARLFGEAPYFDQFEPKVFLLEYCIGIAVQVSHPMLLLL